MDSVLATNLTWPRLRRESGNNRPDCHKPVNWKFVNTFCCLPPWLYSQVAIYLGEGRAVADSGISGGFKFKITWMRIFGEGGEQRYDWPVLQDDLSLSSMGSSRALRYSKPPPEQQKVESVASISLDNAQRRDVSV